MRNFWQDLRYGARMLLKTPGHTAAAVVTLALGIGATSMIFSMVNDLLLRPVPFPDADHLTMVYETRSVEINREPVSPADFLEWRKQNKVFADLAAYRGWTTTITGVSEPERVQGFHVSPSFFQVVGVSAGAGRTFLPDEEQPGSHRVVVLSHVFWQRYFGGAPDVIGKALNLEGHAYTIVGIMPPHFAFPLGGSDFWAPLSFTPEEMNQREMQHLEVLARLKPGVTTAQAQSEMNAIASELGRQYPQTNAGRGVNLIPLNQALIGKFTSGFLFALLGAVAFVLLIACANVGNLQLSRAVQREKEIAIRTSLGASRWRIVRQLLTESLLLSLLGAGIGLLLAYGGVKIIRTSIPPDITRFIAGWEGIGVDSRVLGFTMLIALLTVIIAGLAPAVQASQLDLTKSFKESGKGGSKSRSRSRLRSLLVVAQVAMALALLVSSALMVKGFMRMLENQRRGFDPQNLLTMRLTLPEKKYQSSNQIITFYDQALQQLAATPGVEAAGLIRFLPSSGERNNSRFIIEGQPALEPSHKPFTDLQVISPNCLQALRIPLRQGRQFTSQDNEAALPVTIISESLAQRFFPQEDPVGKRIRLESPEVKPAWITIIGVATEVRNFILDREQRPLIYLPYAQFPRSTMSIVLRTSSDPLRMVGAARRQLSNVDRDQPVFQIKTMEQVIKDATSGVRIVSALMAILGTLALILAAVGVYSVTAYAVTQQTHDIGVRMALGAQSRDVLKLVLKQALRLAGLGLLIGLPVAFALSKVMSSLLFGIIALDVLTFGSFMLILTVIALLASYIPAHKATKIEPMVALRYE